MGRANQDARVHPREGDDRSTDEVHPRARRGELPVDGRGADPGEGRRRDRGRGPAHRAPREFDDDVLNFLVHTASLVAGAIENAQLYEETRRRVSALTTLTQLSQALAAVTLREDLYDASPVGRASCSRADACQIYRLDTDADELVLAASDPDGAPAPSTRPGGTGLVLDLMRRANGSGGNGRRRVAKALRPDVDENALLAAPLVAGDEQLGVICCLARDREFGSEDAELLEAVANQTAVGLKKAELIERLTAENIVKDMFDALAAGSVQAAEAKAGEAGCDLGRPHMFLHVERAPESDEQAPIGRSSRRRLEARLRRLSLRARSSTPATIGLRALAPLPAACPGRRWRGRGRPRRPRRRGGAGDRAQRRRSRCGKRPPADARGRRRRAHRPLACRRRGRGRLRAARRLSLPGPPRARRGAARPLRAGGRGADRVRPAPRVAAGRDAGAVPRRSRQRHRQRPRALRPPEHRAPAARADRAGRGARPRQARTCSRWSWRSSWPAAQSRAEQP